MLCPPFAAPDAIFNVAVIIVEFTTTTFDTVSALPAAFTVTGETKLVPINVNATNAPRLPDAGWIDVSVGTGDVTVKVRVPLVPPPVVTATVRAPAAADAEIVKVAVICVALATTTLLTTIPAPLTVTVAPEEKLVPVSVTCTAEPCTPLDGDTLLNVGAGGGVIVTVADPTAEGVELLAA